MDDICSAEDTKLQCRGLADYAIACSKLGVVLGNWREKITECCEFLFILNFLMISAIFCSDGKCTSIIGIYNHLVCFYSTNPRLNSIIASLRKVQLK